MASAYINDEEDVEMAGCAASCWVGVGEKFSVYIQRRDDDLLVEIYARGFEDCNPLVGCEATAEQASAIQKDGDK